MTSTLTNDAEMSRRKFLSDLFAVAALGGGVCGGIASAQRGAQAVRITVDTRLALGTIPVDFTGLGYEISSVARPGLLSAKNRSYVQLVRTLGSAGVIRIGGNTSDYSLFEPEGRAISAPKGTVVNRANLQELGTFLDATGWKLIWGLNLGGGTEQQAVEEAQAVLAASQDKLMAFEIGNEPDLFGRGTPHRPKGYSYQDYLKDYRLYKAAVRAKLPDAPFAGPDAGTTTDWVTRFAADEGKDLKLLTHHYYRECANPTSSLEKLLRPDPQLTPELEKLKAASTSAQVAYRICETNSFCGGGKPGVSDTFGSALWVLDYMLTLASAGAAGVNMETGVNQLGFISWYSPIGDDEHGIYSARPEYYGMLAFAQVQRGERVAINYEAAGLNLTAYAVLNGRKRLSIVVINKDASRGAGVTIGAEEHFVRANVLRLTGPSLESKDGVMLGGAPVAANGDWKARTVEPLRIKGGQCEIHVPAASAAIVKTEA